MNDLFPKLLRHFDRTPDGRGEVWITCPVCGKDHKHCSFNELGWHCFHCGAGGRLSSLARFSGLSNPDRAQLPPPSPPPPPATPWLAQAAARIARSMAHPERVAAWQRYKPLSRETLDRWQFGYGTLPFQDAHGRWYESSTAWLTVPLYEHGQVVGLRGRNTGTVGPKWISATGTRYVLWGVEHVRPGSVVWLCENYVDAAWLMQEHPDMAAVALGGATTWRLEWGEQLAQRRPALVVVALDNDLAGQAQGRMLADLRAEWHAAHPDLPTSKTWLNGPRIANDLLKRGLAVRLFRWPDHAPAKAGVDWLLQEEQCTKMNAI